MSLKKKAIEALKEKPRFILFFTEQGIAAVCKIHFGKSHGRLS